MTVWERLVKRRYYSGPKVKKDGSCVMAPRVPDSHPRRSLRRRWRRGIFAHCRSLDWLDWPFKIEPFLALYQKK